MQALQYRIWNLGPSSKKLHKGKIWDFGTKLGLFWDQIWTLVPFGTKSQIWDFIGAPVNGNISHRIELGVGDIKCRWVCAVYNQSLHKIIDKSFQRCIFYQLTCLIMA